MKPITILVVIVMVCSAAPADEDPQNAEILRNDRSNNGLDKYSFAFDTSNGISRSEDGELKTVGENEAIVVKGTSSWTAPNGQKYEIAFNADENGYHPVVHFVAA